MRCPACTHHMQHEVMSYYRCFNKSCPALLEVSYRSLALIESGWWFLKQYDLPFRYNGNWFSMHGFSTVDRTSLDSLSNGGRNRRRLYEVPYMALPSIDEDFIREFWVLVSKFDEYLNKLIVLQE